MEGRLGARLGGVRLHTGPAARRSAHSLGARAYSLGRHVVFGSGQYRPNAPSGRWLLAHELAHVAQTRTGTRNPTREVLERDARHAATQALQGGEARPRAAHDGSLVLRFGEPEHVPEVTFVAGNSPQNDGFLQSAMDYHQAWRLRPRETRSLEAIVTHLAASQGRLQRIRIVSHAAEQGLFFSMFRGGGAFTIGEDQLNAYAEGDVEGLRHTVGDRVSAASVSQVIGAVRAADADVLRPFGLHEAGSSPSSQVAEFVQRVLELSMLEAVEEAGGDGVPGFRRAIGMILDSLRASLRQPEPDGRGVTQEQLAALQGAIEGVDLQWDVGDVDLAQGGRQARVAAEAVADRNFRRNLERTRGRFTSSSWIDIRGCNVGGSPSYLRAVANFFGSPGDRPHVSAPEWFQSFPTMGYQPVSDDDVERLARDAAVQEALEHWSRVTGAQDFLHATRMLFYDVLIRARRAELEPENPFDGLQLPSLRGGLPTPRLPELEPLRLGPPEAQAPTLGRPTLTNPLVQWAEEELERLEGTEGELRFYLGLSLLLPVTSSNGEVNTAFVAFQHLENEPIRNWLRSQWSTEAPGLERLLGGSWRPQDPRRVAALTPDEDDEVAGMVISPDPRYRARIREI